MAKVSKRARIDVIELPGGGFAVKRVSGNGTRHFHGRYANTQAARRAAKRDFPKLRIRMVRLAK